mgnify:CR=1 FL=1
MKRELGRRTDEAPEAETLREGVVAGRNAVLEAIKSAASIEKIYVARGEKQGSIVRILALAREKNIVVQEADRVKLDHISGITTHQGVVAYLGQKDYCTVDDMLEAARSRGEAPFLILCDEIADPHNLGAILRTAEVAGAHGVIVPKHRGGGTPPRGLRQARPGPRPGARSRDRSAGRARRPRSGISCRWLIADCPAASNCGPIFPAVLKLRP